ncbi:hypothetical protein P691DRAFT_804200 [Macrolepiota fuliginosa MF-IS2]|uniref:Probable RNA polymerase II nuclear localization protein SLC7A6OS n=1 Tax=Macrolepiota fuliginosa MF-IS2 TaxID=1400762 RepID=A0A9P6CB91_9AGAR|nr:hypothetical protein P691DRAFT_804200 [Macrolepiota fuliginosa MF-IS2]
MEIDASAPPTQSYTILRIKRKRNEEPLDALVIESRVRRKKSRGGVGVFQYAQTVEDDAWKDEKSQKDIQDRISRLAKEAKEHTAKPPENSPVSPAETVMPVSPVRLKKDQTPRYTIVAPDEGKPPTKRQATNPPKVHPSENLSKNISASDFRMFDAILSKRKHLQNREPDPEMEKFQSLLNDYLKIHDISSNATIDPATTPTPHIKGAPVNDTETDDYVWDVFYHRPATLSEWNSVAARTGTITGLPISVLDSDDSDSEFEEEDEADEDSNAEEYYRNDYPDEESTDSEPEESDEFHEDSEHDNMMGYRDELENF